MNAMNASLGDEPVPALGQRTKGVDSARRVLQILLQFTENRPELTIDNVLESFDISVPSAYRYLSLLREMNLIEERSKGTFVLSPRVLQLARSAEASLDYRTLAQPVLARMREKTGETALYLRRVNDAAVALAIAESDHQISISFQPGHLMPLHLGAASKILLSEFSDPKRDQYLDGLRPRWRRRPARSSRPISGRSTGAGTRSRTRRWMRACGRRLPRCGRMGRWWVRSPLLRPRIG
ncbi:hypothetical protein GCM10025866_30990 [Naasia aerilata]|uniref:IclR family transcriptional regulator n=1 Tax=Naasia aerilata TaxID=1162966 RepID=A0ABN6XU75_9MICO|nr:helix-turn-helix domain-containing protein [Naasia aerilata]BDZ47190.1 hypothetical protein GCM10025866_30990 [Naasia aerilata]